MDQFRVRIEKDLPDPSHPHSPYRASGENLSKVLVKARHLAEQQMRSSSVLEHPFAVCVDWFIDGGDRVQPAIFGYVSGIDPFTQSPRLMEVITVNSVTRARVGLIDVMIRALKNEYLAEVAHTPENTVLFSFPNLKEAMLEHYRAAEGTIVRIQKNNGRKGPLKTVFVKPDANGHRQVVSMMEATSSEQGNYQFVFSLSDEADKDETEQFEQFVSMVNAHEDGKDPTEQTETETAEEN